MAIRLILLITVQIIPINFVLPTLYFVLLLIIAVVKNRNSDYISGIKEHSIKIFITACIMDSIKKIIRNKKARHEYFILSTYEAGIALLGTEVKSIREGKLNFLDSYARIRNGELWLIGLHISPYEKGNIHNHDPLRERKLLMHSREIERLRKSIDEKGLTFIPLSIYLKNGKIKVELGLAKGKQLYDKRQDSASRDAKREMERAKKSVVRGQ